MSAPAPAAADPEHAQRQRALVQALSGLLPPRGLLWRAEDTAPYECDGLTAFRCLPLAVALPETTEQAQRVLQTCHRMGVPVVPRGAGTGLSGGATPHGDGLVLSLARFTKILEIDPEARRAVVQAGVRNLAISEASAPHGLYYAPDPSSQIACTIGGNVAENAGGVHCLKYGLTVHNVRRVRALLMTGELVEVGSHALDAPGLDLLALLIGAEGMLAVVTEVTVKLTPKPPAAQALLASFDDVEKGGDAVAQIIASGIVPAGLEMMDRPAVAAVEEFIHAGYDLGAAILLLCEADGTAEEVADEIERMTEVVRRCGATRVQVSQSNAERLKFWSGRKNAFPAAGRLSPEYYCMDGTIPRKHIGTLLRRIQGLEQEHRLRCINVFHAGDGNMHPLILYNSENPGEWERAERFGADVLLACIELGGTITGEHGVGLEKLDAACAQFSAAERAALLAIKAAFDPAGLLNPGKAIPTLHRCAEFGRVRARDGALPHPELPRF
jgi:glycolate oxidase